MAIKKWDAVKIIGVTGTLLGFATSLLGNWSKERKLEETVRSEVTKELDKRLKELDN